MTDRDVFKQYFKRFKRVTDLGELSNSPDVLINFDNPDLHNEVYRVNVIYDVGTGSDAIFGLTPRCDWKVYGLKSKPGFTFIKNPFLSGYQHQWIVKCLVSYPLYPNVCNLDSHMTREGMGGVWPSSNNLSILKDFKLLKDSPLYKLRWVTLGYHYNWTTKYYDPSNHSPFPRDLAHLSQHFLSVLGYKQFKAEAAIVNYYHMDSTLSGHTDHSEKDLEAPLISISFGQSAIFLIGGPDKQEPPEAVLLNSGDVVVMAGETRLAYHGVPKIIHNPGTSSVTHNDSHIPECLSKHAFAQTLKSFQTSSVDFPSGCSLCGRNIAELLINLPSKSSKEHDNEERLSRKRSNTENNTTSSSKTVAKSTDTDDDISTCTATTSATGTNEKDGALIGTSTATGTDGENRILTSTNVDNGIQTGTGTGTNGNKDNISTGTDTNTEGEDGVLTGTNGDKGSISTGTEHIISRDSIIECRDCVWILENWDSFILYLNNSRININIRQVGF